MNKKYIILILIGLTLIASVIFFVNKNKNYFGETETENKVKTENDISTKNNGETEDKIKKENKLKIITSFYPLYFFTSQIVGDRAIVFNITPKGVEPHDYEPTAQDMVNIENSDLLILNGGGLESYEKSIKNNLNKKNIPVLIAGENLFVLQADPHIWLAPILATEIVDKIERKISLIDPTNIDYYKSNADTLIKKLNILDEEYKTGLAICREKNIIVSHSAFTYLAKSYNLNQIAIAGLSPSEEPSSKEMAKIVEFARTNNVKYIFFESLASPKLSQAIAKEVGAKTLVLNPIAGITEEEEIEDKDYFTEMRQNLMNLRIALQCR